METQGSKVTKVDLPRGVVPLLGTPSPPAQAPTIEQRAKQTAASLNAGGRISNFKRISLTVVRKDGESKRDHRLRILEAMKSEQRDGSRAGKNPKGSAKGNSQKGKGRKVKLKKADVPRTTAPRTPDTDAEVEPLPPPGTLIDKMLRGPPMKGSVASGTAQAQAVRTDPYVPLHEKIDAPLADLVTAGGLDGVPLHSEGEEDDRRSGWKKRPPKGKDKGHGKGKAKEGKDKGKTRGRSAERDRNRARDIWATGYTHKKQQIKKSFKKWVPNPKGRGRGVA